jgi:hypothetical protein
MSFLKSNNNKFVTNYVSNINSLRKIELEERSHTVGELFLFNQLTQILNSEDIDSCDVLFTFFEAAANCNSVIKDPDLEGILYTILKGYKSSLSANQIDYALYDFITTYVDFYLDAFDTLAIHIEIGNPELNNYSRLKLAIYGFVLSFYGETILSVLHNRSVDLLFKKYTHNELLNMSNHEVEAKLEELCASLLAEIRECYDSRFGEYEPDDSEFDDDSDFDEAEYDYSDFEYDE